MTFEKTFPLNEFVTLQRGFDLPKDDRIDGDIPVIASTGIGGYHNEAKVEAPGVVIGRSGSIGGGQYITEDFWPLNTTLWVKDFKSHHPRYVYYLLRSIDFQKLNVGSGVPTLNRNHLSSILVADIGYENEKRIAEIIGDLDDKIQLNRQINQTLEQIAQAIFKSWFVDFEPVKAKIQAKQNGQDPERSAMRAISGKTDEQLDQFSHDQRQQLAATAALFPDELIDSELGEIPKGWMVTHFKEIMEKYIDNRGKTPPTTDTGIPLLEVKHLPDNGLRPNLKTEKYVTQETYNSWFRAHLEEDDIIISTVGTIGRICLVPKYEKLTIAQNLLGVRFNRKKASPYFMYYQMDNFRFRHDVDARLVITVQQSIKRKDLETIDLLLPSIEIQDEFERIIKLFVIKQQSTESETLSTLRDSLLPKLLSGEIALSDTQSKAEAVG